MSLGHPRVRYFVNVKDTEYTVDLTESGDGEGLEVLVDGRPVSADLVLLDGTDLHSLLIDGHSREMVLDREGDRVWVSIDGERLETRVQDEVTRALSVYGGATASGASEVLAPMPAVVVEVLVKPGDEVEAGQPVVIVEAMKMQNELAAESAGVVESVEVVAEQTVDGDQVLVRLAPKEPE